MYARPKPIPATPTCCVDCGAALEPLRRYAGLCRECVARHQRASTVTLRPDPLVVRWVELERFTRRRRNGELERVVRVRCSCGAVRVVQLASWTARRPLGCIRCRLQQARIHGVESDYGHQ